MHWAVRATIVLQSLSISVNLAVARVGEAAVDEGTSLIKASIFFATTADAAFMVRIEEVLLRSFPSKQI